jgi:hypothetical protein
MANPATKPNSYGRPSELKFQGACMSSDPSFRSGTVPTAQYYQTFGKKSLVSKLYITSGHAQRIISTESYSLVTTVSRGTSNAIYE